MKRRRPLIGELLNAGIRAILIFVAVEIALLVLAMGIGMGIWIAKGFISGIAAGMVTLAIGQALVILIIDTTLLLDERPRDSTRSRSDDETLEDPKKELETKPDQGGTPRA